MNFEVNGYVKKGYESIKNVFAENFAIRSELGAACSIYRKGELVVDLWGGYKNHSKKEEWKKNTMAVVFSATKGVASMAFAHLHSKGLFEYNDYISDYWPEFACNGKENITISQLFSHRAGLPVVETPLGLSDLNNWDYIDSVLSEQKPNLKLSGIQAYHAYSIGWYQNALFSRIDKKNRHIGKYIQDEFMKTLKEEFYIGLPETISEDRIAVVKMPSFIDFIFRSKAESRKFALRMMKKGTLINKVFTNPFEKLNIDFLRVENPGYTGVGTARGLAAIYSSFVEHRNIFSIADTTKEILEAKIDKSYLIPDAVVLEPILYNNGFLKPTTKINFGVDERSFGTPGSGGAFGFADPTAEIGYAYISNKFGFSLVDDPREKIIRDTLYRIIN